MAVEEPRRVALHRAVADAWGKEVADTLFELVAPSGHELATRADIQMILEAIEAMDRRWDERFTASELRRDEQLAAAEQRWQEQLAAAEERWQERHAASELRRDEQLAAAEQRWQERHAASDAKWDARFAASDAKWDARFAASDATSEERHAASDARLEAMEHRLTAAFERGIREAITTQTRTLVLSQLTTIVVVAGLALGLG